MIKITLISVLTITFRFVSYFQKELGLMNQTEIKERFNYEKVQ